MDQNQKQLIKLAHTKMPFGKYEGWFLIDIPEYYIVWYSNKQSQRTILDTVTTIPPTTPTIPHKTDDAIPHTSKVVIQTKGHP